MSKPIKKNNKIEESLRGRKSPSIKSSKENIEYNSIKKH